MLEGRYFYYFVEQTDKQPRGVLLLDGCKVQEEPLLGKERKTNCFSIYCRRSWNTDQKKEMTDRTYFFTVASYMEMNDWISTLSLTSSDIPRFVCDHESRQLVPAVCAVCSILACFMVVFTRHPENGTISYPVSFLLSALQIRLRRQ